VTGRALPAKELAHLSTLFESNRFDELDQAASRLLRRFPHAGVLWKALGIAREARGRHAEAVTALERAAQWAPADAEVHSNLAQALAGAGRAKDAEAKFRQALALNPGIANAWSGLGQLLAQAGSFDEAVDCLQKAVSLKMSSPLYNRLGNILKEAGRAHEARTAYERAIALDPDVTAFHANLGLVRGELGDLAGAEESLRRSGALETDCADYFQNLGATLWYRGEYAHAEAAHRRAIALAPQGASYHTNLGSVLKDVGRLREACESYRAALERDPDSRVARANLLVALNYIGTEAAPLALVEARKFGDWATRQVTPGLLNRRTPRDDGPLRIGFVSGDLREHPVGHFLEAVLGPLGGRGLQLHAYPTGPRVDDLTRRIQPHFAQWTCVAGMSDEAAAKRIHADGIDILLDLSGHTALSRLPLFAWRPAPVQASWLGYYATTGLAQMDWLLADEISVPAGAERDFVERVWRLPHTRLCFHPPAFAPDVTAPPALQSGAITFGSFQPMSKLSDEVLAAWAAVLRASAGSRLRLQNRQLGDAGARELLAARLRSAGIEFERVELLAVVPRAEYLACHADVDILLDTFPFPGGTTTCEALWMGVPTVTLTGSTMISRQGASLLAAAGAGDWVASTVESYVDRAVAAARDIDALVRFRTDCRTRLAKQPLFDANAFAADLHATFTQMAQAR
jgi:protein O-GlcNAc transferase